MAADDLNNPLERAFAKAVRGAEGYPEFLRQLRGSMLVALVPYHPEMDGPGEILSNQGMTFKLMGDERGPAIPLYTSEARARKVLKRRNTPSKWCCVIEMKGEWLLQAMAQHPHDVAVNPGCRDGSIRIGHKTVQKLADGSVFATVKEQDRGTVKVIEPAEYPTALIQPVFQYLRDRPEVRAAWLFRHETSAAAKNFYVCGLLLTGDVKPVENDLIMIAKAARAPDTDFGVTVLDPNVPALADIMARFTPFYAAPDFRPPGGPAGKA
jgi:hypothetical protein